MLMLRMRRMSGNEKGFGLLETLVALAILSLTSVAFVQGFVLTSKGTSLHEKRVIALSIAQSQVEYVKSLPFDPDGDYPVGVDLDPGYSVDMEASLNEGETRQEVEVSVYHQGDFVFSMTVLKRVE